MSSPKKLFGDVCAYIPARSGGEKARYPRVGTAFQDDRGQISVKLDTLPIPGEWNGWLNIFPPRGQSPGSCQQARSFPSRRRHSFLSTTQRAVR